MIRTGNIESDHQSIQSAGVDGLAFTPLNCSSSIAIIAILCRPALAALVLQGARPPRRLQKQA